MVKRKKTSSAVEEHENGMTVGLRDGIGVDGPNNSARKLEGCDEEESRDQGSEECSTKRDGVEILNPSTTGCSSSAPVIPTSVSIPSGPCSSQQPLSSTAPTPPSHDQHHFLRSSVRPPSKRIRNDSISPTINGHGGAKSKGSTGPSGKAAPRGQGLGDKEEPVGNQKRPRRQWESWSAEDKNSFFEGLYEYGKDFEAIQTNIALKHKKKGKPASMVKNKEQVRHFYYRTWHKISKHIDFANVYSRVLKKSSQELYGLICYAELRKKVGGLMDDKNVAKLNELIQQGMVVELHRKVSSLIEFLKQKWAVQDQRVLKSLQEREALEGTQQHSGRGSHALPCRADEDLFLYPAETSTLTALPSVARVVHSKASCTVHWQESGKPRPGPKELIPTAQILGIQGPPLLLLPRGGVAKPGRGGVGEALGSKEGERDSNCQGQGGGSCSATDPCRDEERTPGVNGSDSASPERNSLPLLDPLVPTTLPPATVPRQVEDVPPDQGQGRAAASGKEESGGVGGGGGSTPTPVSVGRSAQRICEEGWSSRGSDSNVTLAELYLMLGKPGKLQLEYEWQPAAVAAPELEEEGLQGPGQTCPQLQSPCPLPPPSTHRVLRCLLRLVSSEVNPKPAPELCSTATSPVKPSQEEQSLTPPGKALAVGVRSPNCGRPQPLGVRAAKLMLPNTGSSGRNLPRSLLVSGGDSDGGVFAVPTTLPPNSSRHSRMFSPNKEAELAFRQQLDSISMQSDIFLPKQRKNRSRPLRKPLVVQRTLLPRTTGDTPQHVCSFSILSNSSATGTGSFRPIQPRLSASTRAIDLAAKSAGIIPGSPCRELEAPSPDGRPLISTSHPGVVHDGPGPPQTPLLQQASSEVSLQNGLPPPSPGVAGNSLLSPPSMASLLDISLPGPPEEAMAPGGPQTHISDSIIELAINSAHYGDEASLSPAKLNGTSLVSPDKGRRSSLTPSGPSSGTALLGPRFLDCNSHDSFQSRGLPDVAEVDTQLACMMSESSVDYIARFNDLAQELAVTEPHLPPP
ncbi:unnamed protein product [Coregonus sp. 'balchen']|nr:unnamed protein product [Coregonus sp. 'balchen']